MQENFILNEGYNARDYASISKDHYIFINNKKYIDLSNCAGSQIIGHNSKIIKKTLNKLIKKNISNYAMPNIFAVEFSKTLKKILPDFSKFIFCNSGSEAIMKGLRISRSLNNKDILINASGSWHGSVNETLYMAKKNLKAQKLSDGLPDYTRKNIKFVPFGNIDQTKKILDKYKKNINCILIEPIQGSLPTIEGLNYIKFLKDYSKKNNIVFFLDEMITGLRVGGSSFQTSNKIKSDISTFGKCFGGGFPIGILAINKTTSQILKKKKIFFGGTFSGNSISMYIANEITKHVYKNNKLIKSLDEKMKFFKNSINEFALKNKIDAKVFSYTSMARIVFSQKKISDRTQRDFFESKKKKAIQKFIEFLKKKSLYYPKNGIIFFSLSLSKRDLLYIISTIKSALKLYLK